MKGTITFGHISKPMSFPKKMCLQSIEQLWVGENESVLAISVNNGGGRVRI